MRLYSDASHDEDGVIGIAYIVRDEVDDVDVVGTQYIYGDYTSMEAEYNAMMSGIHAASWYGSDSLIVQTDCKPLVTKMDYPDNTSEKWYEYREECHRILNTFDFWQMYHVPRSQNEEADSLAREALRFGRENK